MLLIAFEPAFSGRLLKKLDKELKKVNDPFFLIICIVIKSFSYIQMGLQKLQNFLADIAIPAPANSPIPDSTPPHRRPLWGYICIWVSGPRPPAATPPLGVGVCGPKNGRWPGASPGLFW